MLGDWNIERSTAEEASGEQGGDFKSGLHLAIVILSGQQGELRIGTSAVSLLYVHVWAEGSVRWLPHGSRLPPSCWL